MKQTVKTIKKRGDTASPDHLEVESAFAVGQEISMVYFIHSKADQNKGYISALQENRKPAVGRFVVTDLLVSTLPTPPVIMIELKALDTAFSLRYPAERVMLVEEAVVLKHMCRDTYA